MDPHTILPLLFIKNLRLDHRFKKFVASSVCCICVSPCVLMSVIARLMFSIGSMEYNSGIGKAILMNSELFSEVNDAFCKTHHC